MTFDVAYVIETIGSQAGLEVICDGIDDQCYGAVITSIQPFAQFLQKHKAPYNFQIIDQPDGSILVKRRVINSGLVIDYQLTQADCILRNPTQPAIKFTRADPLTLPREVEVQYVDPDRLYATNTQVARHQGARIFANRAAATAKGAAKSYHGRTSTQIDFIISADQARAISEDLLYRQWTQQLTATFEHPDITIEPGDVFAMTCDQGVYTMLVQTSTFTKERTNQIVAVALLTSSVINVPGGQADPFDPSLTDDSANWLVAVI